MDYFFWMANHDELDREFKNAASTPILNLFSDAIFGNVLQYPGSGSFRRLLEDQKSTVVVALPWLNAPYSLLSRPDLLSGFLPAGCFEFNEFDLLSQIEQTFCVVSFLRACGDMTLVDFLDGVCPTPSPTPNPTTPTNEAQIITATPTSSSGASGSQDFKYGALKTETNFNIVVGIVAALIFFSLLLCCFYHYNKQRKLQKALVQLSGISLDGGSFSESMELSDMSQPSQLRSQSLDMYQSSQLRSQSPHSQHGMDAAAANNNVINGVDPAPIYRAPLSRPIVMDANWDDKWKQEQSSKELSISTSSSSSSSKSFFRSSENDLSVSKMERIWQDNPLAALQKEQADDAMRRLDQD